MTSPAMNAALVEIVFFAFFMILPFACDIQAIELLLS
jgi:hypothetical protein